MGGIREDQRGLERGVPNWRESDGVRGDSTYVKRSQRELKAGKGWRACEGREGNRGEGS